MFFLPHNLCCLCRKGDNPVWSHQSVQLVTMKWKKKKKTWKWGEKCKYPNSLWTFQLFLSPASHIDQSCCLPNAPLMGIYSSQSEFQISGKYTEMKNNMSPWKPDCEDLHCAFILENTKNPPVLPLHSTLKSGVMTGRLSLLRSLYIAKFHRENTSIRFSWVYKPAGETVISGFVRVTDIQPENGSFSVPYISPCQITAMTGTLPVLLRGFFSLSPLSFVTLSLHLPELPWRLDPGGSRQTSWTMTLGK